jgi:hypothetical protein
VLRERTRRYSSRDLPFVAVSIDPVVSPDLDPLTEPVVEPFVPKVKAASYLWKITGIDHAGREVTMTTALLAVPVNDAAYLMARGVWDEKVVKQGHPIDVGSAEVAFAPETRAGDTTSRVAYIQFDGVAEKLTSRPFMKKAHVAVPALATLNRGGKPTAVTYRAEYVNDDFPDSDPAQLYLKLDQEAKLDFRRRQRSRRRVRRAHHLGQGVVAHTRCGRRRRYRRRRHHRREVRSHEVPRHRIAETVWSA